MQGRDPDGGTSLMAGPEMQVNQREATGVACTHSATRVVYFHHVGRPLDHYTSISTDAFCRALDVLTEAASVIDIREYLRDPLGQGDSVRTAPLPLDGESRAQRRIVITFDDGYAETLDNVLEILEDRGVTACFFVVPAWFGIPAPHSWATERLVCADASVLRDAQDHGHAVASHTWSHQHLNLLPQWAAEAELSSADDALSKQGLGVGLEGVVAYPYGEPPLRPANLRAGFGTNRASSDCAQCSPQFIRRVFLHSADHDGWRDSVASWW
jgi:peptidoglycan/xylan/chitin deacetylase (PgdA/CDA1 family)